MSENIRLAQGPAKPATIADLIKDAEGITKPNLHRRINKELGLDYEDFILLTPDNYELVIPEDYILTVSAQVLGNDDINYTLSVQAVNSYRTTGHFYHDEESTTSEIP